MIPVHGSPILDELRNLNDRNVWNDWNLLNNWNDWNASVAVPATDAPCRWKTSALDHAANRPERRSTFQSS